MYRSVFVLLAFVATCAYGSVIMPHAPASVGRIVGGEDTTIEAIPYQVSVRILDSHMCGGSIVNSSCILTAAHCIFPILRPSVYSVEYGSTIVGEDKYVIGVERIVTNENYNAFLSNNDVALMFLSSDIVFSPVAQPIELAAVAPAPGVPALVSGWGMLAEEGPVPLILQQVSVDIVDNAVCEEQYRGISDITDQMLCAGVVGGGKDACQLDSGGPLVAEGKLVGVVSWGVGCGRPNFAGVYSNVASLRDWIDANIA